ncbi:DUF2933 domain-containing protein [Shewanella sp. GutDb-MelDb]|uniref:DUF2933 domain-containing protein n=1 Tax=Shewanella sp. GutDb-MelDb TaxID=2058316 RepID=UPI000C7B0EDD|nr:DUF2933 domain-containing protein [Shewanella sp. GutDb-MelDb]PKG58047.1 hypothetical protein CXF82_06490 [Shewanella sp. GutDb-MelDb]
MNKKQPKFWSSPKGWAALLLIAFTTYFLLLEHREHIFSLLPLVILLLCPLIHLFMHKNHGHGAHNQDEESKRQDAVDDSFKAKSTKNKAYKDGYIQGLE